MLYTKSCEWVTCAVKLSHCTMSCEYCTKSCEQGLVVLYYISYVSEG